jgi:hypothetical protein
MKRMNAIGNAAGYHGISHHRPVVPTAPAPRGAAAVMAAGPS